MGRKPCCKEGVNKGAWSAKEDRILTNYIKVHGEGKWRDLPKRAGLNRCGKSCRLRWLNYLRPDIKRGNFSEDEEDLIIKLHKLIGNRWSLIAGRLPGRTDNEIKNHWNCYLSKKIKAKQSHIRPQDPRNGDSTCSKQKSISSHVTHATEANPDDDSHPVIRTRAVRCAKVIDLPMHNINAANDSAANSIIPEGEESQRPSLTTPNNDTHSNSPDFLLDFDTSDIDLLLMPDPADANGQCSNYQSSREINEADQINGQFPDHLPMADHFADEAMMMNIDDSAYEARSSGNWMLGGLFQQNEQAPMDLLNILHSAHPTKVIDLPMHNINAANDSAANSIIPEGEESQRPSLTTPNNDTYVNSPDFLLDFDTSHIDLLLMPDPADASGQCSNYQSSSEINEADQINGQFPDHLPMADHFADEAMMMNIDDSVYEARSSGNWMLGGLFQQNEQGPMDLFNILHSAHPYF